MSLITILMTSLWSAIAMDEEKFLMKFQVNETFKPSIIPKTKNVICFDYSFGITKWSVLSVSLTFWWKWWHIGDIFVDFIDYKSWSLLVKEFAVMVMISIIQILSVSKRLKGLI